MKSESYLHVASFGILRKIDCRVVTLSRSISGSQLSESTPSNVREDSPLLYLDQGGKNQAFHPELDCSISRI